jgi:hypothetical protein
LTIDYDNKLLFNAKSSRISPAPVTLAVLPPVLFFPCIANRVVNLAIGTDLSEC